MDSTAYNRLTRTVRALLLVATCSVASAFAQTSGPSASNATVSGMLDGVRTLVGELPNRVCSDETCTFALSPLTLSIHGTAGSNLYRARVTLTHAEFPRYVVRYDEHGAVVSDQETRPILFRGKAVLRHAGESGESKTVRIAGAVFRDTSRPYMVINSPRHRRSAGKSRATREAFGASAVSFRLPEAGSPAVRARLESPSSAFLAAKRCGDPLQSSLGPNAYEHSSTPITSASSFQLLHVATDFDPQFQTKRKCSTSGCNNKILAALNAAAIYYQNQFQLTFQIVRQYGPTSGLGTSTDSSKALDVFRRLNNTNRPSLAVDFYQLFTGRTMDSSVIGLAYVGAVCVDKRFSSMLVQDVSDAANPVITAHEAGHLLSSEHSTSGIMAPRLGAPFPTSFAADSAAQILSHLSKNYAQCIGGSVAGPEPTATPGPTETPDPNATPTSTPTPTPTPTPTTVGGGGGGSGGGSGPGGSLPVTMSLKVSLSKSGTFALTTGVSAVVDGCTVTVTGGADSTRVDNGRVMASFQPTELTTTLTGTIDVGVTPTTRGAGKVFFTAWYLCEGNAAAQERSRVRSVAPNTKFGSEDQLKKGTWLKRLAATLTQQ